MSWLRRIAYAVAIILAFASNAWAVAALYFDGPFPPLWRMLAALVYVTAVLAGLWFFRRRAVALMVPFAGFAAVALWWFSLQPSNDRNWRPDDAKAAYADINGSMVTIHDIRNCDYRTQQDFTCRWETRSYDLQNLRATDIFITWWGSPWIAHPIASFDFGSQGHVVISIEARYLAGQKYSAVRGLFRQFSMIYIISDERDPIRLRTNYRKGEDVYLFRTSLPPSGARTLFMDYLSRVNRVHVHPEWYNALTNNCTTNIAASAAEASHTRLDWRVLLNGKMDEMMYEHGSLVTGGLPLSALKEQAHINAAANAADTSPDFSTLIRQGRVGFTEITLHPAVGASKPPS